MQIIFLKTIQTGFSAPQIQFLILVLYIFIYSLLTYYTKFAGTLKTTTPPVHQCGWS